MNFDYQSLITYLSQLFWPFMRIGGLMLTLPVLSSGLVPARIRLIFIFVFAMVCAPFISPQWTLLHFEGIYVVYALQELMLGLLMGFVFQIVFQVFIIGGQIIAMQTGLGFALMVEPSSRASVPLISQFYLMLITLMFLVLNGHLAVFEALIDSFKVMPVGKSGLDTSTLWRVIIFSAWMFKEAVLVALPAILSLLVVSLSFAVITKVAPQLNIFSLGFPITLLLGFVIMKVTLLGIADQIGESIAQGMQVMLGIIR